MSYERWQKRLAGEQIDTFEMEFDFGFYRRPRKEARRIVGWDPVAFFADEMGDGTVCLVGDVMLNDPHAMSQVWLHCVQYPITEEQYRKAADEGIWFDADPLVDLSRKMTEVLCGDKDSSGLEQQIAEAIKGVSTYAKIEDDETASKAQDLRSHLTTLAGKLDKERKELVQPHLDAQREINSRLNPIIKDARDGANTIRESMACWEELKRKPLSDDFEEKHPGLFGNAPAPRAQIRGSTGRAAAVREAFDAVITDISAYFQTVKGNPEVTELLQKLAQKDIDAGLRPAGVEAKPTVRIK